MATLVVAGVDVGGPTKGFHAAALADGRFHAKTSSIKAGEIAAWCSDVGAQFVAVDAPCAWSKDGRARPAERELMGMGIWCFSTPTLRAARSHPKNHFGWMLAGADLFDSLARTHKRFETGTLARPGPFWLETFPHAATCALAGTVVSAKQKRRMRRELLERAGVDCTELIGMDLLDAALCALVADFAAKGECYGFGDTSSGTIFVPKGLKFLRSNQKRVGSKLTQ